ncbi:MAG TPA: hypothetical protein PK400_10700 [Phycisphaerales bacterium]|nr:hypothetical protein [Phycisphaerales bacterium]HRQ75825.1 hypothetical protein [Phycisphaerales bacterium]
MNDAFHESTLNVPTMLEADRAVQEAHRMFSRVLASWAQDVLILRQRRLAACSWRACPDMPEVLAAITPPQRKRAAA